MNISRTRAEAVAHKLTEGIRKRADEADADVDDLIYNFVDRSTPQEVKDVRNKYPHWSRSVEHKYVKGLPISLGIKVYWNEGELRLDEATADKVTKLKYKEKDLRDKADKVYNSIVNALLSIKTYNRCKEAFPEAYALLPDATATSNLPVVQIDSIREQLGLPTHNEK